MYNTLSPLMHIVYQVVSDIVVLFKQYETENVTKLTYICRQ